MDIDTQVVAELSRSGNQEGRRDRVFGVVVYAARPAIMQGPARRVFRHLEKAIAVEIK
jgi:hypothetical protein